MQATQARTQAHTQTHTRHTLTHSQAQAQIPMHTWGHFAFSVCLFICVYLLHVVATPGSLPAPLLPPVPSLSLLHIMRSLCLSLRPNVLPLPANPLPFWPKLQKHKLQSLSCFPPPSSPCTAHPYKSRRLPATLALLQWTALCHWQAQGLSTVCYVRNEVLALSK